MSELPIPSELITCLRAAHRITALTGAGISAESGVPTFREAQTGLGALQSRGTSHTRSIPARSKTGLGMVCLAARARASSQA